MPRFTKLLLLTVVLALSIVSSAQAGWTQHVNRSLGLWWSDGYHAHTNCPPPPARGQRYWPQGTPQSGSPIEYLPTPAPTPLPESSSRLITPPSSRLAPTANRSIR